MSKNLTSHYGSWLGHVSCHLRPITTLSTRPSLEIDKNTWKHAPQHSVIFQTVKNIVSFAHAYSAIIMEY